jgi:hypothetical protein
MKTLVTFSGQFGDILWSLPTARQIANDNKVDFAVMPEFKSLVSLLEVQPYIDKAFAIDNWIEIGRPHGCQPWEAPVPEEYDKVYHLAYRHHPGKNEPLVDFIARQQGITLSNPIPFISIPYFCPPVFTKPFIAVAFNDSMKEQKDNFLAEVNNRLNGEVNFHNMTKLSWLDGAVLLSSVACIGFLGCRSSNYVLACGLGKKVFVYEPNVARSRFGQWGTTFSCPYADETEISYTSIYQMVDYVKSKIVEVVK